MALSGRAACLMNVRLEGNNGPDADVTRCLLMTHSGHLSSIGGGADSASLL
jgi:hypothetical protein